MNKFVSFGFLSISIWSFSIFAKDIKVVIASENSYKIDAVKQVFNERFPGDSIKFISHKSCSGIPEQPISKDIAQKGANNRISNLPHDLFSADYIVSIENYIEKLPYASSWCDKGLILIKDLSSQYNIVCFTSPTFIPAQFIELAKEMSGISNISDEGYPVTIGQAIQKSLNYKSIDPQDWHREVEFGGISRKQLLYDALYKALNHQEIEFLKQQIKKYVDFPKPGIIFADFLPIFSNPDSLQICIDLLFKRYKEKNIDVVVGLESRGFILGSALAHKLGVGFVPVRKPGKLPGEIYSVTYQKEYGSDTLTISKNAFKQNQRVLIIDDLIATGGSARAAIKLVELAGGIPVEFVTLLQIKELAEQARLSIPAFNLIDEA